ncbi:hypothetical protein ACRRTK_012459 [Alexandromys fortis]
MNASPTLSLLGGIIRRPGGWLRQTQTPAPVSIVKPAQKPRRRSLNNKGEGLGDGVTKASLMH